VKAHIILAVPFLIAVSFAAQRNAQKLPSRATSMVERISRKDCSGYRTTNRTYEILDLINQAGAPVPLLLLEAFQNERCEGHEGIRGKATITAWALGSAGNKKLRWTIHSNGNSASLDHSDLLTITD